MVLIGFLFGGGAIIIIFQQIKETLSFLKTRLFFGKLPLPKVFDNGCFSFPLTFASPPLLPKPPCNKKGKSKKEDLGHWDPNGGHGFEST